MSFVLSRGTVTTQGMKAGNTGRSWGRVHRLPGTGTVVPRAAQGPCSALAMVGLILLGIRRQVLTTTFLL